MSKTRKPFVDFPAVRARITMEQVLEHYDVLDTFSGLTGDRLTGPCPIHKGSNRTQFRVDTKKNIWNCFSECKHGGNTLDFIARMENCDIHTAALNACEWFDIPIAEVKSGSRVSDEPEETPLRPTGAPLKSSPSKPAVAPKSANDSSPEETGSNKPLGFALKDLDLNHPYFAERGLTQEIVVEFGLGYCAKGSMTGRIVIPIHNVKGELLGYAGRWPGTPPDKDTPKYKLPPNFRKSLELFNLHHAMKQPAEKPLVIVEGFFDVIKLHQHGWRKVVALMGSTMSAAQGELIRQHTDSGSHVIVMLDEDEAGRFGREDIAAHLSRFCFVKTHVFDKSDMQPEHLSAEEVREILGGAV